MEREVRLSLSLSLSLDPWEFRLSLSLGLALAREPTHPPHRPRSTMPQEAHDAIERAAETLRRQDLVHSTSIADAARVALSRAAAERPAGPDHLAAASTPRCFPPLFPSSSKSSLYSRPRATHTQRAKETERLKCPRTRAYPARVGLWLVVEEKRAAFFIFFVSRKIKRRPSPCSTLPSSATCSSASSKPTTRAARTSEEDTI